MRVANLEKIARERNAEGRLPREGDGDTVGAKLPLDRAERVE